MPDIVRSSHVKLYKYVPFDDGARAIIRDGTVKFSSPFEFNDPFDCSPRFNSNSAIEFVRRRPDIIKGAAKISNMSPAKRIQKKEQMIRRLGRKVSGEDFWREAVGNLGVFCLSRNPLNLLMWSHYADKHRGVVIEFNIPVLKDGGAAPASIDMINLLVPLTVTYLRERPEVDFRDTSRINVEKEFLTKGIDWEYEQEERVIDHIRGFGIHQYNRNEVLRSVIAGVNMTKKDREEVRDLITHLNNDQCLSLAVYEARLSTDSYEMYVPGRPDLLPDRSNAGGSGL